MILKSDGQVSSMSISEAQGQGFSLTTSVQRIVLRSPYKQPHTELTMVSREPVLLHPSTSFHGLKLNCVVFTVVKSSRTDDRSVFFSMFR